MNDTRYLTEIIEEVDNLPCSHPASVNIDVANYYYSLTKIIRPLLIVEIGCFIGFSTLHFAQALKELGFGKILSIDAFDWEVDAGRGMENRQAVAEYYRHKAGLTDIITYKKGYSTVVYPQIADNIKNKIDLLYIDGDHSITGAFADFNTYYNDVRVGGHLVLHDIYPQMCGVDGPRVLIDHLKAYKTIPNDLELMEIQTRDGFGIAVLRKLSAKPLYISLPEPHRMKRLRQKLQGRLPWLTKIPQTFGHQTFKMVLKIMDARTFQPISQATLIVPQRWAEQRTSDAQGKIYLEHYLPNRYLFKVSAPGYVTKHNVLIDVTADKFLQEFTILLESLNSENIATVSNKSDVVLSPKISRTEWPLFARMQRFAEMQTPGMKNNRPFVATTDNVPVRVISLENFTQEQLFAEIAALPENGGEIYLPPGRIEMTSELKLRTGIRLVGVADTTEFVFKNTYFGIVLQGTVTEVISQVRLENVRIRHEGPHQFCAAVFVTYAQEITFTNVQIIAPRAIGFLLSDNVYRTHFEHCAVHKAGLVGFMLIRDVRDTVLESCLAEYCQQSGVFLTDMKLPPGVDPLDFDAQIHYTSETIGNFGVFSPEDPCTYRNTLQNCIFRNNRKMGITTDGVGYLRVLNCVMADNDCEGITLDNGSWGCQVQNCHIYNNGWRGRQQEVELNLDFVSDKGRLADGSSKAKLPGVSLDNAAYCRIENNCIEGNWGDGVKFVRAVYACTVVNNLIANNNRGVNDEFHFFGVLVGAAHQQHPEQSDFPSCDNRITDNDILGTHYAGIHLLAGVSNNSVQNNRITEATFAAIEDHTEDSFLKSMSRGIPFLNRFQ
ncbi:MAG: hypothetical protein BWK79_04190 [Beggiatoa sp. IS2]|nr:MAG: hypothetical protein BWK79_04190 [Beggiatoa sp. IS2]